VFADAEAAQVWVNSADDVEHCTFILPAVHRDGVVSIAISTGGASPALASWLRRRMGEALEAGLGTMAAILEEARLALKADGRSTEARRGPRCSTGLPRAGRQGRFSEARAMVEEVIGVRL